MYKLVELLVEKLKINVLAIAVLVTIIILSFGDSLMGKLGEDSSESMVTLLSTLIGVGIGGLIAVMVRIFESPNVPADMHERMSKSRDDAKA